MTSLFDLLFSYLQFLQCQDSLDGLRGADTHSAQEKWDLMEQKIHVMKLV